MTLTTWPCPLPDGGMEKEYALAFDRGRAQRVLIVPALFDEGNRMRRLTVEVMRRLDRAGIDSLAPDLPGTNESVLALESIGPAQWRTAMAAAAAHFGATHVLGIRGGCLFTPSLPKWHYAPVKGAQILRSMLRARMFADREAGREQTREALTDMARTEDITLAGYPLNAALFREIETLEPDPSVPTIEQERIGGSGLWLRAEPDEDASQADALAALLSEALRA